MSASLYQQVQQQIQHDDAYYGDKDDGYTEAGSYSTTSDHKAVSLIFNLLGINSNTTFKAFCYNMSYLGDLDLGYVPDWASEAFFLSLMDKKDVSDKRSYWKRAALLAKHYFVYEQPHMASFIELNDRDQIIKNPAFTGGYQALLECLNNGPQGIRYEENVACEPYGSYYRIGSFKVKGTDYNFLAYSLKKGVVYPTVLTIWDNKTLGGFDQFYGNDFGRSNAYSNSTTHTGRNFSCVRTTQGANLITLHAPNDRHYTERIKQSIEQFLDEAAKQFNSWVPKTTVIAGDTNAAFNYLTKIELNIPDYGISEVYSHLKAPNSCCCETGINTLNNYTETGDKIYVANPSEDIQLYDESNIQPITASGITNLKRKKNVKKRPNTLKKRPNILKKKPNTLKKRRKSQKKRHSYKR